MKMTMMGDSEMPTGGMNLAVFNQDSNMSTGNV